MVGYVVDSVLFALFCAAQAPQLVFTPVLSARMTGGGDMDTKASLAGQVVGALLGPAQLPLALLRQLPQVPGCAELL